MKNTKYEKIIFKDLRKKNKELNKWIKKNLIISNIKIQKIKKEIIK